MRRRARIAVELSIERLAGSCSPTPLAALNLLADAHGIGVAEDFVKLRWEPLQPMREVIQADVWREPIIEGHISYLLDGSIDEAMTYGRLLD